MLLLGQIPSVKLHSPQGWGQGGISEKEEKKTPFVGITSPTSYQICIHDQHKTAKEFVRNSEIATLIISVNFRANVSLKQGLTLNRRL